MRNTKCGNRLGLRTNREEKHETTTDKLSTLSNTLYKYTGTIFFTVKEICGEKQKRKTGGEEIVELSKIWDRE
jgi:hypothetical protein